jgi:hypothetical protein
VRAFAIVTNDVEKASAFVCSLFFDLAIPGLLGRAACGISNRWSGCAFMKELVHSEGSHLIRGAL